MNEYHQHDNKEQRGEGNHGDTDTNNNNIRYMNIIPNNNEDNVEEPIRTIRGGQSEIFNMARRMMVWNDEESNSNSSVNDNDTSLSSTTSSASSSASSSSAAISSTASTTISNTNTRPLPRWHPHEGIADSNPSFRSKPPLMNNKGYALLIRRNSRKRNKRSLWRHAYRTYNQMKSIEEFQYKELNGNAGSGNNDDKDGGLGSSSSSSSTSTSSSVSSNTTTKGKVTSKILITRHVIHFEAALVSCAKLGLWREALSIYNDVQEIMKHQQEEIKKKGGSTMSYFNTIRYVQTFDGSSVKRRIPRIVVTDNMILSIVKACVRGSKNKDEKEGRRNKRKSSSSSRNSNINNNSNSNNVEANEGTIASTEIDDFDKREPLDAARDILLTMEEKYNIPLVSRHINPLAAAYQHIGLYKEGSDLISSTLADRKTQAQDKEEEMAASFNLNDVKAKDAASYNILIQGAITEGDWASAIGSLGDMTRKGIYPESRSLNCWSETARKRETRAGSRKTTWKKNRERLITGTTIPYE